MCGIAGLLLKAQTRQTMRDILEPMTAAMKHRGPNDATVWVSPEEGVAFGHRRLAILDLSPAGRQPMRSESGRYIIVFNGEIYNHRALRAELLADGAKFKGHSDTEVLLAGIDRWGIKTALQRAVGMFALGLWDRKLRRLCLARDRAGEKPLYYGKIAGAFAFGSELRVLQAHPGWHGELNFEALAQYLRFAYVPAPMSIYRGIEKLRPGHLAWVEPEEGYRVTCEAYWSPRQAFERGLEPMARGLSEDEACRELEALLKQSVAGQMEADVPVGAFLSGGVDSSLVVALMQAQSSRKVKTFSIGFEEAGFNEAEHAKAVAAHLGTDHVQQYVTAREALDLIPDLPAIYDEPFADSSQIPTAIVARLASRQVKVCLSGDGGDEVFAGYNRHVWADRIWHKTSKLPWPIRAAMAKSLETIRPGAWRSGLKALQVIAPGVKALPQIEAKMAKVAAVLGSRTLSEAYGRLTSVTPESQRLLAHAQSRPQFGVAERHFDERLTATRMMQCLDFETYLPDDILVKVDRATMNVSMEGRAPLLDHRLWEFAGHLPSHFLVHNGRGKALLRKVLDRHVPRALIERPKSGFAAPVGEWLQGPLVAWARDLLEPTKLRSQGLFDATTVSHLLDKHIRGEKAHQYELWTVLMFECWLERATSLKASNVEPYSEEVSFPTVGMT